MFAFKKKKNTYWLRYNKWNFFFTDSMFWFSKKIKIKNSSLSDKKKTKFTSFFYHQKNYTILRASAIKPFLPLFKLAVSLNNANLESEKPLIFALSDYRAKIFFLFKQSHYFLNYKNACVIENVSQTSVSKTPLFEFKRKIAFLNFNEACVRAPLFFKKINNNPFRLNRALFLSYNLIRLFYKTRRFGFFPFNSSELRNGARTYVTRASTNCNKFFIFKSKRCLYSKTRINFISNHAKIAFLFARARYTFVVKNEKSRALPNYFSIGNKKKNKVLFSKFWLTGKDKNIGSLQHIFNFSFLGRAVNPLFANLEFFFSQSFSPLTAKLLTIENSRFFKMRNISMFGAFIGYHFNNFFFYSKSVPAKTFSNLIAQTSLFTFAFKKFIIRTFSNRRFPIDENIFHYETVIRFLEFCSGKKIYARFNPFMTNLLTLEEKIRCSVWSQKLKSFRKVLGPRLFLNESLQIIYFCLKNKDVYVLSSWMLQMFYKISFWKYKLFFRYMQYILRYFFWAYFEPLKLNGLKFQMKGKISVAGNARTRKVLTKIGTAGHASFKNRILYDLKLIRTFTGVIGFKTWIFF